MKRCICIAFLMFSIAAFAQDATWQNGSGNFTDTSHWDTGLVPGIDDNTIFPDGSYSISFTRDEINRLASFTSTDSGDIAFDLDGYTWQLTNGLVYISGALNNKITIDNGSLIADGLGVSLSCFHDALPSYLTFGENTDSDLSYLRLNNAYMTINGGTHKTSREVYIPNSSSTGSKISSLTISNATFISNNSFWCGGGESATGVVNVLHGGTLNVSNSFSVGNQRSTAVGIINVDGGDVYTHSSNWVGNDYGATAYINLYDGTFRSRSTFELGHRIRAKAHLNITGGKFTADSNMYLANYQESDAIGGTTGTVTITGGELEVKGDMELGRFTNCFGRVSVNGNCTSTLKTVKVGYGPEAYGEFHLTDGVATLSSDLEIGTQADSDGVVTVDGGTLNVGGNAYAGHNGTGVININGGITTFNNAFTAGNYNGSDGTANINGGLVTIKGGLHAGRNTGASGAISVNGGIVSNTANVYIGNSAGTTGSLTVDGGDFYSSSSVYIGHSGNGTLALSSGNTAIMNQIYVGNNSGSTGSVEISGGTFTNRLETFVGYYGKGGMTISGGTNYFTRSSTIGYSGEGTLNITGGETIFTGEHLYSATSGSGTGRINVSGGHLDIIYTPTSSGYLDIGGAGECIMEMTGGLVETEILRIGPSGGSTPAVSKLIMNGGRLNVSSTQYLADTAAGTGVVHLINGVLSVRQLRGWWGQLECIFDGGTLEARQDHSTFIYNNNIYPNPGGTERPLYHILTARGLVIDSNGHNVGTPLSLPDAPGEHGKLTKKGLGRFTIYGTSTFTGPIAIEEGEVDLGSSGMVTLAGGVQIDGAGVLDLSARNQDFTMGASSESRVDGTVQLASGRDLIFPATSSLTGTGTLERVTMQSGSTLVKEKTTGESVLNIANLTIDSGANVELSGYTEAEFKEGVTFISGTNLDLTTEKNINFTLNGVPYEWVAVTTTSDGSGGYTVSAKSYNPGTVIVVE